MSITKEMSSNADITNEPDTYDIYKSCFFEK